MSLLDRHQLQVGQTLIRLTPDLRCRRPLAGANIITDDAWPVRKRHDRRRPPSASGTYRGNIVRHSKYGRSRNRRDVTIRR